MTRVVYAKKAYHYPHHQVSIFLKFNGTNATAHVSHAVQEPCQACLFVLRNTQNKNPKLNCTSFNRKPHRDLHHDMAQYIILTQLPLNRIVRVSEILCISFYRSPALLTDIWVFFFWLLCFLHPEMHILCALERFAEFTWKPMDILWKFKEVAKQMGIWDGFTLWIIWRVAFVYIFVSYWNILYV